MFEVTVECPECNGTARRCGSRCNDCNDGQVVYEERYYETVADVKEDYPDAIEVKEVPQVAKTHPSNVPVLEDVVVNKQSDLNPYQWGTVERQMLELIDEKDLPDVVFGPSCGVANSTISSWRTRDRRPDLGSLYKVADHLGYKVRLVRDEY